MSDDYLYDLAITGGGLAGLSLAIQSATAGYRVILFEKEDYPLHKVCGEYISLESWNFLQSLGVPLAEWKLPVIKKLQASDINGSLYNFELPLGGFGISRYKLDEQLYQLALSKGVRILVKTKVEDIRFANDQFTVKTNAGAFTARLAAGSFGKRSNIDIRWNRAFVRKKSNALNNYIAVKYHIRYTHSADAVTLHNFYNGYCGISKIEDDISCLCYLTTAANLQKSHNSISEMEASILQKNPRLSEIFNQAEFLWATPLVISQVSFNKKSQIENGVLMLGDAAGMIAPLCGNGMSMAMHASSIAFSCINKFLKQQCSRAAMEANYLHLWQKQFSTRLFVGRTVQRMFGGNFTTKLFFRSMQLLPFFARMVIRSSHGKPF